MRTLAVFTFLAFSYSILWCQSATDAPSSSWLRKLDNFRLQPVAGLQLWQTYSWNTEVFNNDRNSYEPVDARLGTQFRRIRLGIKGQPYERLSFNVTLGSDFIGRDVLGPPEGGANNANIPAIGIWHAFAQWRISNGQRAFLTIGWLAPRFGRESITGAFNVATLEKAWSQNYVRRHLVGRGPGRATGLNLGGLVRQENAAIGLKYDIGVFNSQAISFNGNSAGRVNTPLFTSRLALEIGDPENTSYSLGHKINYFGERKGLTIATNAAYQGATDLFERGAALGVDVLLNLANFNFDGEYNYLIRQGQRPTFPDITDFSVHATTGYVRASYNIELASGFVLEPVAMYVWYNGETELSRQLDAAAVSTPTGKDRYLNVGFNLHFNPKLKLGFHYTDRSGDAGELPPGNLANNFFTQGGVGAIRRGDWLGLGLVTVL